MSTRTGMFLTGLALLNFAGCGGDDFAERTDKGNDPKTITALESLGGEVDSLQEGVMLTNSKITDEELKLLTEVNGLKVVDVSGTRITDAGLEHLKEINSLTYLDVSNTRVTDAGFEALKAALPDCTIIRENR